MSHGHGRHVAKLLADLATVDRCEELQVTLTHNVQETVETVAPENYELPLHVIHNSEALGFAENHNNAFEHAPKPSEVEIFVILNPDTRIRSAALSQISDVLRENSDEQSRPLLLGPRVVDSNGHLQQTGRLFPGFSYLALKLLGREPANPFDESGPLAPVDWIAGMCIAMRSAHFKALNGLDTAYRLYYEDVDLCLRAHQDGGQCMIALGTEIEHEGQWQSRRNLRHMTWHIMGMARFLSRFYRWPLRGTTPQARLANTTVRV